MHTSRWTATQGVVSCSKRTPHTNSKGMEGVGRLSNAHRLIVPLPNPNGSPVAVTPTARASAATITARWCCMFYQATKPSQPTAPSTVQRGCGQGAKWKGGWLGLFFLSSTGHKRALGNCSVTNPGVLQEMANSFLLHQHTHWFGSANWLAACRPCLCQRDPQLEVPEVAPPIHGNTISYAAAASHSQWSSCCTRRCRGSYIQASPRPHMGHLLQLIVVCFFVVWQPLSFMTPHHPTN